MVDEIIERLGRNVNIMDDRGVIIASGDRGRVGAVHDGARRVLETGEPFSVTGERARELRGTRAGVNLPIRLGGGIAGVVGVSGEPAEVGPLAEAVVLMSELLITHRALRAETEWRRRARTQIVEDLASGRLTAAEWRQRLRLVGARLVPPYRVHALRPRAAGRPPELGGGSFGAEGAFGAEDAFGDDPETVLAAVDATGTLWVVGEAASPAPARARLAALRDRLPEGGTILDAGEAAGFAALADTVGRGRLALCGTALPDDARLRDLEVQVLLARAGEDVRAALAERVLGPLDEGLRATLGAYFAHDRRVAEAARALGVHRNTLVYRLGRAAELTSYDPRRFDDAVTLRVALLAAGGG